MGPARKALCIGLGVGLVAAMQSTATYSRASKHPLARSPGCERAQLFGEGPISSPHAETSGTISPDGRTLYFTRMAPDFGQFFHTILVSHVRNGKWSEPQVAPFSGRNGDTSPFFSPDGRYLVFSSNRPVGGTSTTLPADFNLWVMERRGSAWSEPRPLTALNTPAWEMHSAMTRDYTIYFGRLAQGNYDIWRASYANGTWQAPEPVGAPVNTQSVEYDPFIDPDGRYLIFGSDRAGGQGSTDFYISFNRNGSWSQPMSLGDRVNTSAREAGAFVSRFGGRTFLIFNSESGRALGQPMRPRRKMNSAEFARILSTPENRLRNFYYIDSCALGVEELE